MTDEKIAAREWKKYFKAIKKHKLDDIQNDAWHRKHLGPLPYMEDSFFVGFYLARDIFKEGDE